MEMVDPVSLSQTLTSTSLNGNSDGTSASRQTNGVSTSVNVNGHTPASSKSTSNPSTQQRRESESESLDKLVQVSVILLRQAVDLVNETLSEDAQLTFDSRFIPGSTIGKHLRHAVDHFSLLLDSLSDSESSQPQRVQSESELELTYDVRARGTPMESSRSAAKDALESCIARLQSTVPSVERDKVVKLTAVTPYVQTFRTSFGRELWFAALHAVHHWSMVRVMAGELGLQLEDSFGVAPSTLVYRGTECSLGRAKI